MGGGRTYRLRLAVSLLTKPWNFCDLGRAPGPPGPLGPRVDLLGIGTAVAGRLGVEDVRGVAGVAKDHVEELADDGR